MSANFPPANRPASGGVGGLALQPDLSGILKACERLGPVFVLFRNEGCILGSVAEPLWFLDAAGAHLAASGSFTLNPVRDPRCAAFRYVEHGPSGGLIDAVEFTSPDHVGFLKLCRMDGTDHGEWACMLGAFQTGAVDAGAISSIRKANHLTDPAQKTASSPADVVLTRFLETVVATRAQLHVTAGVRAARARLVIQPEHQVRVGQWAVLSSGTSALHLATGEIAELRAIVRPHLALLVLLGPKGRLIARILTRDRRLLAQFPDFL